MITLEYLIQDLRKDVEFNHYMTSTGEGNKWMIMQLIEEQIDFDGDFKEETDYDFQGEFRFIHAYDDNLDDNLSPVHGVFESTVTNKKYLVNIYDDGTIGPGCLTVIIEDFS